MIAEELDEVLRAAVARHGVPGAAAGVLVDGEVVTAACGVTNVEHPLPVDDRTLFQVGSITKTFTSAAVMLLVEDGLLSLEDPVGKHLPDLAAETGLDTDAITVEHTLSHQAGFDGDHLFVGRVPDSLAQLHDARRLFAPGTSFSYCNAGFSIAGAVAEAIAGESFASFVGRRLLSPLGLEPACFSADGAITHRVAAPHLVIGDSTAVLRGAGWQPGWELGPIDHAAGGLVASVRHLLRWAQVHVDGDPVLARSSIERMHAPVVNAMLGADVALDWVVRRTDGVTTIEHGGLTVGYCSDLVIAPEPGVAVTVLTHATNGGAVNQAVRRWALQRLAGIDERDPVPDPTITVDASRVAGQFLYPFAVLTVEAGEQPNTLRVSGARRTDVEGWKPPPDPPTTFAFVAPDHAVSTDAAGPPRLVRFGFGDDGRADWLQWGLRRSPRVD